MNHEWTYTIDQDEWVNETFKTKEETIKWGKISLEEDRFFVGQLIGNDKELVYKISNVEEIILH